MSASRVYDISSLLPCDPHSSHDASQSIDLHRVAMATAPLPILPSSTLLYAPLSLDLQGGTMALAKPGPRWPAVKESEEVEIKRILRAHDRRQACSLRASADRQNVHSKGGRVGRSRERGEPNPQMPGCEQANTRQAAFSPTFTSDAPKAFPQRRLRSSSAGKGPSKASLAPGFAVMPKPLQFQVQQHRANSCK